MLSSPFISCGNRGVKGCDQCTWLVSGRAGISSQTHLTPASLSRALGRSLLTFLPPHSSALSSASLEGEAFSRQCHHLVPRLETVGGSPGPIHSDSWPFLLVFDLCFRELQIPPPTCILKRRGGESGIMTLCPTAFLQRHE